MQIAGKNVVFVGGFGEIGLKTSQAIAKKHPKNFSILDECENAKALKELQAQQSGIKFYKFDVSAPQDAMKGIMEKVIADMGHIDIFIYGALFLNDHDYAMTTQVNFLGLVNSTAIILPHMDRSLGGRGGLILTIASVSGLDPFPTLPVYSASKAAAVSFCRSLAQPMVYQRTGVSFITVCQGLTNIPLLKNVKSFLDLDPTLPSFIVDIPNQSVEVCAKNIVKVITEGANGSIWMLDSGSMELVEPKRCWKLMEDLMQKVV